MSLNNEIVFNSILKFIKKYIFNHRIEAAKKEMMTVTIIDSSQAVPHLNLIDSFTDAAGVQSFDGLLQFGQTVTIHVQNLNKNTHTHTNQ